MSVSVTGITRYPGKSMRGVDLDAARLDRRGLEHDRRFMLVDEEGQFLTARKHPDLLRVGCRQEGGQVSVAADGRESLHIGFDGDGPLITVRVWKSVLEATAVSPLADEWFSGLLGFPCRLVFMGPGSRRAVDPDFGRSDDEVSFADGFPILIISEASLDELNGRLQRPITMRRFRPNLVLAGCTPHAEDSWRRIRVGDEVELELVKQCRRCVLTTRDPETGAQHPDQQPLKMLATYRRGKGGGVCFGMNAIPRRIGEIRVGDPVTVIAAKPGGS